MMQKLYICIVVVNKNRFLAHHANIIRIIEAEPTTGFKNRKR